MLGTFLRADKGLIALPPVTALRFSILLHYRHPAINSSRILG